MATRKPDPIISSDRGQNPKPDPISSSISPASYTAGHLLPAIPTATAVVFPASNQESDPQPPCRRRRGRLHHRSDRKPEREREFSPSAAKERRSKQMCFRNFSPMRELEIKDF
ncbi:hypothetical protein OROMI_011932 [Orobanche minor]